MQEIKKQEIPFTLDCGVGVIKVDEQMTLQAANANFYQLLKTDELEFRRKYGSRLSAILLPTSASELHQHLLGEKQSFQMELKLHLKETIWLQVCFYPHTEAHDEWNMLCTDISGYKQLIEKYHEIGIRAKNTFSLADVDLFEIDIETMKTMFVSSNSFFKAPQGEVVLPDYFLESEQLEEEDMAKVRVCFQKIADGQDTYTCELHIHTLMGIDKWVKMTLYRCSVKEQEYLLCMLVDITAEKEATYQYLHQGLFYQAMLSDQDAFGHTDITANRILRVGGLWNLYNEVILTMSMEDLFKQFIDCIVHPEDREHYKETVSIENLKQAFENGITHLGCEFRRIVEQNKMAWMKLSMHLIKDPTNQHLLALMYIKNIDMQKKQPRESSFKNELDSLTGLYNRKTMDIVAERYFNQRENTSDMLIYMDIDYFREVNRRVGAVVGDEILVISALTLKKVFRESDVLSRFGGDEFLILLKNVKDVNAIERSIRTFMEGVSTACKVPVTFSIGMVVSKTKETYINVLHKAMSALLEAREKGGNQIVLFENQTLIESEEEVHEERKDEIYGSRVRVFGDEETGINHLVGTEGDIAYLVEPKTFELLCGNEAFYHRTGKTRVECYGKKCYELLHNRKTTCPFCRKDNWSSEKYYVYRNYNRVLEQEFLIKNKLVEWHGKEVLLALAIDLSNNKSIVDSLENDTTENNCILNGIENMDAAENANQVIECALETFYTFYRAKAVRFWEPVDNQRYNCTQFFTSGEMMTNYTGEEEDMINKWLQGHRNSGVIKVESPEVMMCESYEMYQMMLQYKMNNQLWIPVITQDNQNRGMIEVDSISINYLNETFYHSFLGFFKNEWNKRELFDGIIYHNLHDDLTGLLNRNCYESFLNKYEEDKFESYSVIFMNIDSFSEINAEKGVEYGDYVLIEFSKILQTVCKKEQIFRLNGDEFLIAIPNVTLVQTENIITRIKDFIQRLGQFSVSFGYAWDNVEKNIKTMIKVAEQSMRIHKENYYDELKEKKTDTRYKTLMELMQSLEQKEFEVYLQAKVDSDKNEMFGAEALIRYIHKDYGVIAPAKFLKPLEKFNLIRYIDMFVFEEVCRLLDRWTKEKRKCPIISLNFSRKTLIEDHLVDTMLETVQKYDVDKKNIEIEITEDHAGVGKSIMYQSVKQIRKAGFSVSLDDFGTDYTNLSILSELDFETLKIDRSLIHSLAKEKKNNVILKNVIQMCRELNVSIIAEGVEEEEQVEILRNLGCTHIQGYLYSKPVPVSEFEESFMSNSK